MLHPPLSLRIRGSVRRVILLGAAAFVLVVLQPMLWALVRDSSHRVWENQSRREQVAALQGRIAASQAEEEGQRALLDQLSAVVPGSQNTLPILERLESVAQRAGVAIKVKGIREGAAGGSGQEAPPDQGEAGLLPLAVTVTVTGQPDRLFEYLAGVEHIPELTQVRSLHMGPLPAPALSFEMTMEVIFYLQPQSDGRGS